MAVKEREVNPAAFMGVGVCLIGSGVALAAALGQSGARAVGISLIGLGVVFAILGFAKKREPASREDVDDSDDRPPA